MKSIFLIVYKYLLCLTYDSELAEELTQDTFLKAITKIHTFKGEAQISTWLCSIAKNLCYNELKKKKRIILMDNIEINIASAFYSIEDEVIEKEQIRNMRKEIKKLDPKVAEVINLRINGGLSFKEIGLILGRNENWARVTFYRGKNKLREGEFYGEK